MLDFDVFKRVVDEAGPSLVRIDFFNYGEAFLHKRAVEMCEYIKHKFPHIYLYTSTNGPPGEEQVRRLIRSGIDEVTFSIGSPRGLRRNAGAAAASKAIRNLRFAVDEARSRQGRAVHQRASSSLTTMRTGDAARPRDGCRDRRRPPLLGADRSSRGLAHGASSPGRRTWRAFATRSGTTTTWGTPSRALRPARRLRCAAPFRWPGCHRGASRTAADAACKVRNASTRPFSTGDLRAPAGQARGPAMRS